MLFRVLYISGCLVAPLLWGLFAYAVTRWLEKKLPRPKPDDKRLSDLEYHL